MRLHLILTEKTIPLDVARHRNAVVVNKKYSTYTSLCFLSIMITDFQSLEVEYLAAISDAANAEELFLLGKRLFGRQNGVLTEAMHELKNFSPEEKKMQGRKLNMLKTKLEQALEDKRKALLTEKIDSIATDDLLDITMDLPERDRGHLHLIPEFMRQVEEVFGRMGFDVSYGPEVETEEYHFDLLNFPKDHAARDWADVFYVKGGTSANRLLLRGHTSPVQIRYMQTHKPPFRMICPGKTYRKDADATHSPMFHQFEGLMIGKDVSLRHMKGVMIAALTELLSGDLEFRFRTGFFPFVEPGLEMDVRWRGKEKTKEGDWLEVVGCGMVHPNVLKNVKIDPAKWQGFAFGFGVERLLMIKHQIPDIRLFFQGDPRFLRQF